MKRKDEVDVTEVAVTVEPHTLPVTVYIESAGSEPIVARYWRDGRSAPNAARDEAICRVYMGDVNGKVPPASLRDIGRAWGLTAERVRQILIRNGVIRRARGNGRPVDVEKLNAVQEREAAELRVLLDDERSTSLRVMASIAGVAMSTLQLRLQRAGLAVHAQAVLAERRARHRELRARLALTALARLALELGHTPSQAEINARSRAEIPSHVFFVLTFGSLANAQRAAGLEPNKSGARRNNRNAAGPRRKTADHKTEPNTERRGE